MQVDQNVSADAADMQPDQTQADAGADAISGDMLPPLDAGLERWSVASFDTAVTYRTARPQGENVDREVLLRVWYPENFQGRAPVILISHGGNGSENGHTRFTHLSETFAQAGYVTINLNHASSPLGPLHRWDRPHDVSAVLDALVDRMLPRPPAFEGRLDLDRIGHLGHSWGAYTAHAVANARFTDPSTPDGTWQFGDDRIHAIVALSPQGPTGFGAFDVETALDQPSNDNSWSSVAVPAFCMIGALEMNGVAGIEQPDRCPDCFRAENWRLFPYTRYQADGRRYAAILPGATHEQLGVRGTPEQQAYIATNSRAFFDAWLRDDAGAEQDIGRLETIEGVEFLRK